MIQLENLQCGESIHSAIDKAIREAAENSELVTFRFNGVSVFVAGDSDRNLIYRDWQRATHGYLGDNPIVGPRPSPVLSVAELASDAKIQRKNKQEAERQADECRMKAAAKLATTRRDFSLVAGACSTDSTAAPLGSVVRGTGDRTGIRRSSTGVSATLGVGTVREPRAYQA